MDKLSYTVSRTLHKKYQLRGKQDKSITCRDAPGKGGTTSASEVHIVQRVKKNPRENAIDLPGCSVFPFVERGGKEGQEFKGICRWLLHFKMVIKIFRSWH